MVETSGNSCGPYVLNIHTYTQYRLLFLEYNSLLLIPAPKELLQKLLVLYEETDLLSQAPGQDDNICVHVSLLFSIKRYVNRLIFSTIPMSRLD